MIFFNVLPNENIDNIQRKNFIGLLIGLLGCFLLPTASLLLLLGLYKFFHFGLFSIFTLIPALIILFPTGGILGWLSYWALIAISDSEKEFKIAPTIV